MRSQWRYLLLWSGFGGFSIGFNLFDMPILSWNGSGKVGKILVDDGDPSPVLRVNCNSPQWVGRVDGLFSENFTDVLG